MLSRRSGNQVRAFFVGNPCRGRVLLAGISACLTLTFALAGWRAFERWKSKKSRRHGYGIAFVDSNGRYLSRQQGRVQLMLDPHCVFRLRPGQSDPQFNVDKRGYRRTGGQGGQESSQRFDGRAGESPCIAVLGGSTAFGYLTISDESTFVARLAERFEGVRFVNAACPGHLSGQELSMMVHYVDDEKPVAYIVFDGWNEVVDQDAGQPRFAPHFGFNNAFFAMQDRLLTHHRQVDPRNKRAEVAIEWGPTPATDSAQYQAAIQRSYVRNLAKMQAFAKARGARLLVVFQPELTAKKTLSEWEGKVLAMWDKTGYRARHLPEKYRALVEHATRECAALDIPCVDLLRDRVFVESESEFFFDPVHLNELGHAVVAERLASKLPELLSTTMSPTAN